MVEFAKYTPSEEPIAREIVKRGLALFVRAGVKVDALTLSMDLAATHAHTPLRLAELLEADDFEFAHDIGGIVRHIDRETGELRGCFCPRFMRRVASS